LDSDPSSSIILLLFLIFLHAFFAAAEVALVSVRRSRLLDTADRGSRSARLVLSMTEDSTRLLTTTQLALKLSSFVILGIFIISYRQPATAYLMGINPNWSPDFAFAFFVLLSAVLLAILLLIVAELIPKAMAVGHAEGMTLLAAYPVRALALIASPVVSLSAWITRLLTGGRGHSSGGGLAFVTEEQIKTMVDAGEEGGFIEEDEKEMIYSIFELGDTLAREVMVPRVDVIAIDVDTPLAGALSVIVKGGHSRIPVYQDTIDNVVGMLYAKDLLAYWPDFEALKLADILREVYYIPETKPVDELLQELQQRKVHIAVVVDEYGGVAGLVTIEDILEEIVGEIQDEYDSEEDFVEVVSPDEVIFNSRIDLDDVNHDMGIELPTDSSDTLGGLVYSSLGRVAVPGDTVSFPDAEVTVLSVTGRRIKKIKVKRLTKEDSSGTVLLPITHDGTEQQATRDEWKDEHYAGDDGHTVESH